MTSIFSQNNNNCIQINNTQQQLKSHKINITKKKH